MSCDSPSLFGALLPRVPQARAEGLPGCAWESWVAWPVACVLAASRARNLSCFCFLVWFSVGLSRIHSQALGGLAGSEPGGDLKCRLLRGQGGGGREVGPTRGFRGPARDIGGGLGPALVLAAGASDGGLEDLLSQGTFFC